MTAPADPRPPLTSRQAQVYAVIASYIRTRGFAPTVREIGAAVGIRSTNCVSGHLDLIVRKGYLRRESATARGLVLADDLGLDCATRARCGAVLREILDGSLCGKLPLTPEEVRALQALRAALGRADLVAPTSPVSEPAPGGTES